jgi:exodeoxyribonuclease V beta subunit
LQALLALPLLNNEAPCQLRDLQEYQVEMEFWFASHRVDVSRMDALVREHTHQGAVRAPAQGAVLNGMFKGFIDLTFEHQGRYYVVDYKSNWLGADDSAYTWEAMDQAILEHRYDLQYVLYVLALHRQLRARLPDYDYDHHVGGALFVFLRGVHAPSRGCYFVRPQRALIEQLDALFRGVAEVRPDAAQQADLFQGSYP